MEQNTPDHEHNHEHGGPHDHGHEHEAGHDRHDKHEHHHEHEHHVTIYVDEVRYEVHHKHRTGAEIKALADRPKEYQLFLERPGQPDDLIDDAQTVTLKHDEHFHTIPPAQFG